jgi:2-polyprenyl-3-methyl-5-hydroxy-6-metoxy-1,4-benzoquinol methylase
MGRPNSKRACVTRFFCPLVARIILTRITWFSANSCEVGHRGNLVELELLQHRRTTWTSSTSWGQFLTPSPIAEFMASLFEIHRSEVHLLDAGAGAGALSAALIGRTIARCCGWRMQRREVV